MDLYPRRCVFGVCMPACREGERTEFFFFACAFQISLTGERYFQGIFTIGGGAFGGFMPAGWEGKRAVPFSFALPRLNFHGVGGRGSEFWWIATLGGGAFGICTPACREGERDEILVALPL